jgi:two-component system OmpR family response regulator
MMPLLDGWTVLSRLRQKKRTPVLLLTARDTPPDRVKGLDLGADDYLIKPFDLDELLARLRALIRRAAGGASNVVTLGTVTIDVRAKVVTADDVVVSLTATEYRILEYLALHRGRVVSRTELFDHLRGDEDDTFSNVMDVHVAGIRRKIGSATISTRRGQGYCIE